MNRKSKKLICLGLEGTAEKTGVGIVTEDGEVLYNNTIIYKPPLQGINPREAADHHAETFIKLLKDAFNNVNPKDIDLVAFSQGPGLGPSLRVTATAGRALALSLNKPIIGVNHCVGHVEIGKLTTPAKDPLTLYVSGGNTQILAYVGNKYRVIGETHDIAIGNCLDQFARSCGLPHPGGVYIEQMAKKSKDNLENRGNYLKLPYTIKGMDLSLSGLLTAAIKKSKDTSGNHTLEDVCYSLQETAFAMLTEITERALAHTNKSEVMLVGGVAANDRLKEMLQKMCNEQNVDFYVPEKQYCGDNGAMIGWLGILQYKNGKRTDLADTKIMPNYRADMVGVNWINNEDNIKINEAQRLIPENLIGKGAEADIEIIDYLGNKSIKKTRIVKGYRVNELDILIRQRRTVKEARFLNNVKNLGICTPTVYDVNKDENSIIMEFIDGVSLKDYILSNYPPNNPNLKNLLIRVGESIAKMHNENIIHNDLTTSNFMVSQDNGLCNESNIKLYVLDFGLAKYTDVFEDRAIDLIVLKKALISTHYKQFDEIWNNILEGYKISKDYDKTLKMIDKVEKKGRYL
ncbi:bifunctional N(6)-L-threonylcarbamoyladenine synthase/serine/threonine protein kinase [Methanococcus voltae]|uniref:bifunctional N(6)-L-threonylcarbamoyladenine synthase/serine/threonine protein kinase n=1 Tax=Methanococcus voltae TaxID=2188 RepID=UPI001AE36D35|nr:bifunctional N(6)-L-threonylcarbamoyladenine synthase/serine/threonine protein kinase [Methanococcus voltae]MBP2172905.1 N6-L-threonylcarbamoyladenine synthase/protein kinase Bud32 [Methanococcus voltae]